MSYKSAFRFGLFGLVVTILIIVGAGVKSHLLSLKAESHPAVPAFSRPLTPTQAMGPLRLNPANPRYFTDDRGQVIYLTGSHTWANLQDIDYLDPPPAFDYLAYLDFLETHHHNFIRLWAWEQAKWAPWTTSDIWFVPLPYQRPGPGTALDGKPKFDVTQFNQLYFDRLRERILLASQRGIYVSIMLFNGFSVDSKGGRPGQAWLGHPYNGQNNINGINGDANHNGEGEEIHLLQISAVTTLQEAYVQKVINTVNDLDNVLYEISNESHANSQDWQKHMINFIKNYESSLPKQHPVGMTVEYPGGNNAELFASPADWISPNEAGGYKDNPPATDGSKVILIDTDHLWGVGGDRQWVWKSFTRGYNPIYMDCYAPLYCEGLDPNDPTLLSVRRNLGATLVYAQRMDLAAMLPRPDLCSTQYCLANPAVNDAAYLTYLPEGGVVTVDLSATPGELNSEWFNPETGATTDGGMVAGGANRSFTAPFVGDAVLYLYPKPAEPTFRLYLPVAGQGIVSAVPAGPYTAGQPVTLSAVAAPGWAFAAWKGDVAGLTTPLTLTMTQDMTITALFVAMTVPTYTVTLRIVGQGAVALTAAGPFTQGQTMQITALPDPSWTFTGWSGNLRGPLHSLMTTITNPLHITATFATNQSFVPTVVSK